MKKVCIFGSCVSRDIFRVAGVESGHNIEYFARSSIISAVADPIPLKEDDIKLDSQFQRRMVLQDVHKTFFDVVDAQSPDVIIIDLIDDERFHNLKVGQSYLTKSGEATNGGVEGLYPSEVLPSNSEETFELWEQSCRLFSDRLKSIAPEENIVTHKAFWATNYVDGGHVLDFPNVSEIEKRNTHLNRKYEVLNSMLPNARVISLTPQGCSNHTWGLSPVHYTDTYYHEVFPLL